MDKQKIQVSIQVLGNEVRWNHINFLIYVHISIKVVKKLDKHQ